MGDEELQQGQRLGPPEPLGLNGRAIEHKPESPETMYLKSR
jgi:hypothetical protein